MSMPIDRLLRPRSVAIVGASEREEATGSRVLRNLRLMNFDGPIFPVNPRYETIAGLPCYPSLSAIPDPVDAAFLAVPAEAGPNLVDEAAQRGIKALFIYASGYADGGAGGAALQKRVTETARRHGIAVSGPNHIGLVNVHDGKAIWTPRFMSPIRPGPVAVISQSGSVAMILSEDERNLGLAYVVTVGNEAVVTVADYLNEIARDDRVSVILLFLETVRDPGRFAVAAREANTRGKHIIALKVGSSEGGRAAVQAHTGGLAGDDRLYDAFFDSLAVIRVHDLDEMLETAALLAADPAPPPAPHAALVTLSGGEAALLADLGGALGLEYPSLSPETVERLRPAFPSYSRIGNPLDGWGLGFNRERFKILLDGLVADPAIGIIGLSVDAPGVGGADVPYALVMAELCAGIETGKRFVFLNNTAGTGVNPEVRRVLDEAGIPYLSGMRPALAAIRNLQTTTRPRPSSAGAMEISAPLPDDEPSRFRYLTEVGVPMVRAERAQSAKHAAAIAAQLGFPVVLKGIASHLPHKSEFGLVRLGLMDGVAVREAFVDLDRMLKQHATTPEQGMVVVQGTAPAGIELIVGIRNQPGFGSFVITGPGGVLVEISNQSSIRRGPVDAVTARTMLEETAAGKLLRGVRGAGPWDMDAAADAIARFSALGAALMDKWATIEINPLIVGRTGVAGVDVLFEPHRAAPETYR